MPDIRLRRIIRHWSGVILPREPPLFFSAMARSEVRKRDLQVLVRLDNEEAAALDRLRAKRSRPDWFRAQLQSAAPSLSVEPEPKKKQPTFAKIKTDASINYELVAANRHLARNTGALIQLAKAVREERKSPSLHADIELQLKAAKTVLAELQATLRRQGDLK